MLAKSRYSSFAMAICLVLAGMLTCPMPLLAQFFKDESKNEEFVESEESFFDERGGQQNVPTRDFSEGGQFVDEERAPSPSQRGEGGVTITSRKRRLELQGERDQLPLNSAWGAGTGLLIGGWFAMIANGDSRDTQRSIGLGLVVGALLGVLVGMKTLIRSPGTSMTQPPQFREREEPSSLVTGTGSPPFLVGFSFRF